MTVDIGLLILRVAFGLILMAHGSQKMFGWFKGPGLKGFSGGMVRMGLRPPLFWATLAALGEFGGGLLFALGLLTPLGALGMMGAMFVAMVSAHLPKGFWNSKGGIEFPLSLWTVAFAVGLAGPGNYSLDHLLGLPVHQPLAFVIVTVLGMAALYIILRVSKPKATPAQPAPAQPTQPAAQPDSQPTAAGKSA